MNLVNEHVPNKDLRLDDVSYELVASFKSEKYDTEKVYGLDVKTCCNPIENPTKEEACKEKGYG